MLDKNSIAIKTGDIVRAAGSCVKKNNGLWLVTNAGDKPGIIGTARDIWLARINRDGTFSKSEDINHFPFTSYASDRRKAMEQTQHDSKNATLEVVTGIDTEHIRERFAEEAEKARELAEWKERNGLNPADIAETKSLTAWYEAILARIPKATQKPKPITDRPKPSTPNQYGVKVGDIFEASWGYEQTNVDFFQVVRTTKTGVYVREVHPQIAGSRSYTAMSEDRIYTIDPGEMLEPAERSAFIRDQKNGDFKKIDNYGSEPSFSVSSYASAFLLRKGWHKTYVSSYY